MARAVAAAAREREKDWKLGAGIDAYSDKMAHKMRALRRDVDQAIIKRKAAQSDEPPEWLVFFLNDAPTS
eukprot:5550024-Pyramimonas_sp.AAC.1